MAPRVTVVGLRRTLLARGLTLKPTCPECKAEKAPADLDKSTGACWDCARRVLALRRIDVIDARLTVLWAASREITDGIQLVMIDEEQAALEQERYELYWMGVASAEERSHA